MEKVANYAGVSIDEVMGRKTPVKMRHLAKRMDRYPNRAEAIAIAEHVGYAKEAIDQVASIVLKAPSGGVEEDPPIRWWLERIQLRDRELQDPFMRIPGKPIRED